MGKAFSLEEREELQEKLRRTGLKLLAEDGIKNISIRQLTSLVGISQGGFYTFYKDKDDFVEDLFLLRIREKTELMYSKRKKTLDDPRGFVIDLFYKEGMHLKENKAFVNSESDTVNFFLKSGRNTSRDLYKDFALKMFKYWEDNGYKIEYDLDALLNVGTTAGIIFSNAELIDEKHFSEIYRTFCEAEIDRFFKCKKGVIFGINNE